MASKKKGKSGAVALTQGTIINLFHNRTIPAKDIPRLAKYIDGAGTVNQTLMAAAGGIAIPELRASSLLTLDRILGRELEEGPRHQEFLCPDAHEGMYLIARAFILWRISQHGGYASDYHDLAQTTTTILGWELALAKSVATPDGDPTGLPGVRAPLGASLGRRALTEVYREVYGLPHRGTGGRVRKRPDIDSPADILRTTLETEMGHEMREYLTSCPLPPYLRLGLTIQRWPSGSIAALDDPGTEEARNRFVIRGSAFAKSPMGRAEGGRELPTSWIRIDHGKPTKHTVSASLFWREPPPAPPEGEVVETIRIPSK